MDTFEKLELLARRRKKGKGKKSGGSGRSGMLRVVMKFLSGDRGDKLANAVNNGDPDTAKNIWNNIADDLYQAVEMIRDEKAAKGKPKEKPAPVVEDKPVEEKVAALSEPKGGGQDLPIQPVKDYIKVMMKPFNGFVEMSFQDANHVKMKKGYKQATYFRLVLTLNGTKNYTQFIETFNKLTRINEDIYNGIKLVGIPDVSGRLPNDEYNIDFIYYES